jgi:hypothetical protein
MPGAKRRKAIAALLFAQAALFGWGCLLTLGFLVTRTGDPRLLNQLQLWIEQGGGFAAAGLLAVFILRGSRLALYGTVALGAISSLLDLGLAVIVAFWAGPLALTYVFFFSLPSVPSGVVAIPVLILSLSLFIEDRRLRQATVPAPSPGASQPHSPV